MDKMVITKPNRYISMINIIGFPLASVYGFSMLVYPWFSGDFSWDFVQGVWDRWQALNVGMLAFLSSVIAFNIARYNAEKQRVREFLAAKAFLPQSLSELTGYFNSCAALLKKAWGNLDGESFNLEAPGLPKGHKETFQNCIRHAESEVGDYLSEILVKLQINHSRLYNLEAELSGVGRHNLITYIYCLGELQGMINKLFGFARNTEDFDSSRLEWDDFRGQYISWFDNFDRFTVGEDCSLENFTKRAVERNR